MSSTVRLLEESEMDDECRVIMQDIRSTLGIERPPDFGQNRA